MWMMIKSLLLNLNGTELYGVLKEKLFIAEKQSVIEDALMKIYLDIDEIPGYETRIEDRNGQIIESVLHIGYCEGESYIDYYK